MELNMGFDEYDFSSPGFRDVLESNKRHKKQKNSMKQ